MKNFYKIFLFTYLLFLPFTSIGIKIGNFKLTISDSLIMFFFISSFFLKKSTHSKLIKFFKITLIFLFLVSFSIIKIISVQQFIMALLPWIYTLILIYSFSILLKKIKLETIFRLTYSSIIINIILSTIIVILYKFFGLDILDTLNNNFGGRYTYFTINPNQNVFYLINMASILLLINIYQNKNNKYLIYIILIMIFPVLETGSRTGFILYILILFLTLFYLVLNKQKFRVFVLVIIFLFLQNNLNSLFESSNSTMRAISVLNKINNDPQIEGVSGESIDLGKELFLKNPFFGIGLGNFHKNYYQYEIHNTFISLLAETGIVGFYGFLILLFYIFYSIFKSKNNKFKFFAFIIMCIFLISNTAHFVLRERWIWILFIFIIFLSNFKKNYVRN